MDVIENLVLLRIVNQEIEELLNKYCRFLPVAIKFGTKTEVIPVEPEEEAAEDAEQETKEIEVDNIVNNTSPAWKKKPSELSDDDYRNFYNELYPFSQPPMFWIHLNIDYPFNLTGILYFPKLNNALEVQKNKGYLPSGDINSAAALLSGDPGLGKTTTARLLAQ